MFQDIDTLLLSGPYVLHGVMVAPWRMTERFRILTNNLSVSIASP